MATAIWAPAKSRVTRSNIARFMMAAEAAYGPGLIDCERFYQWSLHKPEEFWSALWEFCDIKASQPYTRVVENFEQIDKAHWFPNARLNFAENLLRFRDDQPALIAQNESGQRNTLSHNELHQAVMQLAGALRSAGIGPGDRVVGYLPNIAEGVVALLATACIGATWSACPIEMEESQLLARLHQLQAKLLFATDQYLRKGVAIDCQATLNKIIAQGHGLAHIVLIPSSEAASTVAGTQSYGSFFSSAQAPEDEFAQLPFAHPLHILYAENESTGIIHSHGGTLIQHLKELVLHTDVRRSDTLLCSIHGSSSMMGSWLMASLALGSTLALYDGELYSPKADILFDLVDQCAITILSVSTAYLSHCESIALDPAKNHDLATLRTLLSTGSPLSPQNFDFVYQHIKQDLCVASLSGKPGPMSCFALGNPLMPVRRGEIQCRGLGMKIEVFNPQGDAMQNGSGELVCTASFPSMPTGFWDDPDGSRFHQTFLARFPGAWTQGEHAELTPSGSLVMHS